MFRFTFTVVKSVWNCVIHTLMNLSQDIRHASSDLTVGLSVLCSVYFGIYCSSELELFLHSLWNVFEKHWQHRSLIRITQQKWQGLFSWTLPSPRLSLLCQTDNAVSKCDWRVFVFFSIMASAVPQKRMVSSVFITLASPFRATVTPTTPVLSSPVRDPQPAVAPLRSSSSSSSSQEGVIMSPSAPVSPLYARSRPPATLTQSKPTAAPYRLENTDRYSADGNKTRARCAFIVESEDDFINDSYHLFADVINEPALAPPDDLCPPPPHHHDPRNPWQPHAPAEVRSPVFDLTEYHFSFHFCVFVLNSFKALDWDSKTHQSTWGHQTCKWLTGRAVPLSSLIGSRMHDTVLVFDVTTPVSYLHSSNQRCSFNNMLIFRIMSWDISSVLCL